MFIAVSTLSPVSTHSAMPASLSVRMHPGTPTWSLSSIAVHPRIVRFFSTRAAAASRAPFRSFPKVAQAAAMARLPDVVLFYGNFTLAHNKRAQPFGGK